MKLVSGVRGEDGQPSLDLTLCDTEPVKYTGAIMPDAVALVLNQELRIVGASANTEIWLGVPVHEMFGLTLQTVFGTVVGADLSRATDTLALATTPYYLGCHTTDRASGRFDVFGHRTGDCLLLELEPVDETLPERSAIQKAQQLGGSVEALKAADTWQACLDIAVRELKRLTGFDTVLGVKFLEDGSMEAAAEARGDAFPSYLDKRFPRSDIPKPGREQMRTLPMQYSPDLDYNPVPLVMAPDMPDATGVDLGRAWFRSISRVCNQFYLNVGVRAKFLLSLFDHDKPWGFFVCWNASPRRIPFAERLACLAFAEVAGLVLVEKEKSELNAKALATKRQISSLNTQLSRSGDAATGFDDLPESLAGILDVGGVVLSLENEFVRFGNTPTDEQLRVLLPWLEARPEVFETDRLPRLTDIPEAMQSVASGLLAARLLAPQEYLLCFRGEWRHEVRWAGDPRKPVVLDTVSGQERLTPRGSFETWKETVKGCARPWLPYEIEAISDLRAALVMAQARLTMIRANVQKSQFLANMSHEMRTPLNAIIGMAHILRRDGLSSKQESQLDIHDVAASHLLNIINDVLDMSKIEAGKFSLDETDLDLGAVCDHVISLLTGRAQAKGLRLEAELAKLPCGLRGDPTRLTQALLNYATNAVKFTERGSVSLRTTVLEEDAESLLIRFEVRDTGMGISAEKIGQLFSAFEQGDVSVTRHYGGTGLGLAITKHLAYMMGGSAGVSSTPGMGSTFWFSARLRKAAATSQAQSSDQPREDALKVLQREHTGKRVLLAEDDPVNQFIAEDFISQTGLVLDMVDDGVQALEKLRHQSYDLILMDMQMPRMGGIETTEHIRATAGLESIPVIAMTANAFTEDGEACLKAGMTDFLSKPVMPDLLYETLLKWLTRRH